METQEKARPRETGERAFSVLKKLLSVPLGRKGEETQSGSSLPKWKDQMISPETSFPRETERRRRYIRS